MRSPRPPIPRTPKVSSHAVAATGSSPAASAATDSGSLDGDEREHAPALAVGQRGQRAPPQRPRVLGRGGQRRDVRVEQAVGLAALDLGQPRADGDRGEHQREADPDRAERRAEHEHGGGQRADEAERQRQREVLERLAGVPQAAAEVDRVGGGGAGGHGPLPTLTSPLVDSAWIWNGASSADGDAADAAAALVALGVDAVAAGRHERVDAALARAQLQALGRAGRDGADVARVRADLQVEAAPAVEVHVARGRVDARRAAVAAGRHVAARGLHRDRDIVGDAHAVGGGAAADQRRRAARAQAQRAAAHDALGLGRVAEGEAVGARDLQRGLGAAADDVEVGVADVERDPVDRAAHDVGAGPLLDRRGPPDTITRAAVSTAKTEIVTSRPQLEAWRVRASRGRMYVAL